MAAPTSSPFPSSPPDTFAPTSDPAMCLFCLKKINDDN